MSLLSVEQALSRLLESVAPTAPEMTPLADAAGRALAADLAARRTQPPFAASAMDGYAVRAADAGRGAKLQVVGESRAGLRFQGALQPGQAIRIFTGAPVPEGADAILIQENAVPMGDLVSVEEAVESGRFIRPAGLDFRQGDILLRQGQILHPRALALAASMDFPELPVRRRPTVAILSTGDELVPAGSAAGPDQIISSNSIGLAATVRLAGGVAVDLGIAPDSREAIGAAIDRAAGADILVIAGGASVGDHDLTGPVLAAKGMALDFWRIAMRPGKPLMVGRLHATRVLGLPGNPVSALVCAELFLKPLIWAMLGIPSEQPLIWARLGAPMAANDGRQEYARARITTSDAGPIATPYSRQDSSMLAALAAADALIVRPPHAPALPAGEAVPVLLLR